MNRARKTKPDCEQRSGFFILSAQDKECSHRTLENKTQGGKRKTKKGVADGLKTTAKDNLIFMVNTESVGNSEERIWLAKYRAQALTSLGRTLRPRYDERIRRRNYRKQNKTVCLHIQSDGRRKENH